MAEIEKGGMTERIQRRRGEIIKEDKSEEERNKRFQ